MKPFSHMRTDLPGNQEHHFFPLFFLLSFIQGQSRSEYVVRVHTGLVVKTVPHDRRQEEEDGLDQQDDRDPLIVNHHLTTHLICQGNPLLPRKVICVTYPAVAVKSSWHLS